MLQKALLSFLVWPYLARAVWPSIRLKYIRLASGMFIADKGLGVQTGCFRLCVKVLF